MLIKIKFLQKEESKFSPKPLKDNTNVSIKDDQDCPFKKSKK